MEARRLYVSEIDDLLEALDICEDEDREFIQDELFAEIQKEHRNIHSDKPQWWRIRWGYEQPRSEEHFNECRNIWIDKLKDGSLYKEFPINQQA
jgi:hypothetical protein